MTTPRPSPAERRDFRRFRDPVLALLLLVALVAAYWPARRGEFLLDDDVHVTRPELRSWSGLGRIWAELGATQQYYPLLHTAFWLEHRLWGEEPLGYHLVNVGLHAGAVLLLVAILRQLGLPGAWLAGAVFALHPVAAESVAWISEQKNTLSTCFYLAAALAYLRFDITRRRTHYLLASAGLALALGSKTATATLPAALLVVLWWRRSSLDWRRDVLPLLPWFAAAALAGLVTIAVERSLTVEFPEAFDLTAGERCLLAGRAICFYFGKLLWPANLTFFYERWSVDTAAWWQYLFPAAVLAVAAGLVWLIQLPDERPQKIGRAGLAALLLFAGTLFPVLGFFDVEWFVFSFVADHLQYLASVSVIATLCAGLACFAAPALGVSSWAFRTAAAVLLGILGMLTWRQSSRLADNVSLYRHAAALVPSSALAHNHLGVALARRPGGEAEALAAFSTALRLNPTAAEIHENLGDVLRRLPDRLADAVAHYETALRLRPGRVPQHYAEAQFELAKLVAREPSREPEAIVAYLAALRHDPRMVEAHYNLGNLLLRDPARRADAIRHYEAALRLRPEFAEAHANLGTALAGIPGRLPEAITHFEAALRLQPDFAPARRNLQRARQLLDSAPGPLK